MALGESLPPARDRAYVRLVDHAIRPILNGSDLPVIVADGSAARVRRPTLVGALLARSLP